MTKQCFTVSLLAMLTSGVTRAGRLDEHDRRAAGRRVRYQGQGGQVNRLPVAERDRRARGGRGPEKGEPEMTEVADSLFCFAFREQNRARNAKQKRDAPK